jgi:glycosyltransferase involved in cell wall biosynthesis
MKDPRNIIRAVAQNPKLFFTLVGDGPIHSEIMNLFSDLGVSERVECITAIPNNEWIEILAKSDLYVSHCAYSGISKGVLEAALVGIPIIINRNNPLAPEYSKGWVSLCDNTPDSYLLNINEHISNQVLRNQIRTKAFAFSSEVCSAINVRKRWQEIYLEVSKKGTRVPSGI